MELFDDVLEEEIRETIKKQIAMAVSRIETDKEYDFYFISTSIPNKSLVRQTTVFIHYDREMIQEVKKAYEKLGSYDVEIDTEDANKVAEFIKKMNKIEYLRPKIQMLEALINNNLQIKGALRMANALLGIDEPTETAKFRMKLVCKDDEYCAEIISGDNYSMNKKYFVIAYRYRSRDGKIEELDIESLKEELEQFGIDITSL